VLPLLAPSLTQLLEDVEAAGEGSNERGDAGVRRLHFGLGHGVGGEGPQWRPCMYMYVFDYALAASRGQYLEGDARWLQAASPPVQSITRSLPYTTPMSAPNSSGATRKLQRQYGQTHANCALSCEGSVMARNRPAGSLHLLLAAAFVALRSANSVARLTLASPMGNNSRCCRCYIEKPCNMMLRFV
jgi:hypothetical protein